MVAGALFSVLAIILSRVYVYFPGCVVVLLVAIVNFWEIQFLDLPKAQKPDRGGATNSIPRHLHKILLIPAIIIPDLTTAIIILHLVTAIHLIFIHVVFNINLSSKFLP